MYHVVRYFIAVGRIAHITSPYLVLHITSLTSFEADALLRHRKCHQPTSCYNINRRSKNLSVEGEKRTDANFRECVRACNMYSIRKRVRK